MAGLRTFQDSILQNYERKGLNPWSSIQSDKKYSEEKLFEREKQVQSQIQDKTNEKKQLVLDLQKASTSLLEIQKDVPDIHQIPSYEKIHELCRDIFSWTPTETDWSNNLKSVWKYKEQVTRLLDQHQLRSFEEPKEIETILRFIVSRSEELLDEQLLGLENILHQNQARQYKDLVEKRKNDFALSLVPQFEALKTLLIRRVSIVTEHLKRELIEHTRKEVDMENAKAIDRRVKLTSEMTRIDQSIQQLLAALAKGKATWEERIHHREEAWNQSLHLILTYLKELPQSTSVKKVEKETSPAPLQEVIPEQPTQPLEPEPFTLDRQDRNLPYLIRDQFPELEMKAPVPVESLPSSQCSIRDPNEDFACKVSTTVPTVSEPKPYQKLLGILSHPRFKNIRGELVYHTVGTGKTRAGTEIIKTWMTSASLDYNVTREVLILVPQEGVAETWIKELQNAQIGTVSVILRVEKSIYLQIEKDNRIIHIVVQLYGHSVQATIFSALRKAYKQKKEAWEPWVTYKPSSLESENRFENFPEIYQQHKEDELPPLFLNEKHFSGCFVPPRGLVLADEAHFLIKSDDLRGSITNAKKATAWGLCLANAPFIKIWLFTATPIPNLQQLLLTFKLLNMLKFPDEPKLSSGVWLEPIRLPITETEMIRLDLFQKLENTYLQLNLETNRDALLQWYAGLVSYMTLAHDPSVYPQVRTFCPAFCEESKTAPHISGCWIQYKDKKMTCFPGENKDLLPEKLIPIYVQANNPKPGRSSRKYEGLSTKMEVCLECIQKLDQQKHFVLTGSKNYEDFGFIFMPLLQQKNIPYYDFQSLIQDLRSLATDFEVPCLISAQKHLEKREDYIANALYSEFREKWKRSFILIFPLQNCKDYQSMIAQDSLFPLFKFLDPQFKKPRKASNMKSYNTPFLLSLFLSLFNHPQNNQGRYFSAFFADNRIREGINFFMTFYVHFLRVPENWTSFLQSTGRITRFCSLRDVPSPKDWIVRVFLYLYTNDICSPQNNEGECSLIQHFLQINALSGDLDRFLRQIAIDCALFSLYTTAPGEAPLCPLPGTSTSSSVISSPQPSETPVPTSQPEPAVASNLSLCALPSQYQFQLSLNRGDLSAEELAQSSCKQGTLILFQPYNEIDAFLTLSLIAYFQAKPNAIQSWKQTLTFPKMALSHSKTSFDIIFLYLNPNGISQINFHNAFQDVLNVEDQSKKVWLDILWAKRNKTLQSSGEVSVKALEDLATLRLKLIAMQLKGNKFLLKLKEELLQIPSFSPTHPLEKISANPTKDIKPEIQYILAE